MTTHALDTDTTWTPDIGFGDRLRRIRLTLGLNQEQFAASIGMKGAAYAHHELRATTPRNAVLIANSIEARHRVPAWWTLGESGTLVTRQYRDPRSGSGSYLTLVQGTITVGRGDDDEHKRGYENQPVRAIFDGGGLESAHDPPTGANHPPLRLAL